MKANLSLGDRIKFYYENRCQSYLLRKIPVIIRLDGKCFHTFTKYMKKPFDENLNYMMVQSALYLCKNLTGHNIQGIKCIYLQSDEISILISDLDTIKTEAWFDYNIQKLCSISASIYTAKFNEELDIYNITINEKTHLAYFDSRCFNLPIYEIENYFIWRQKDWERNSIQMLAQFHFSHKQLHKKKTSDMHKMLFEKGINWANLEDKWKNGTFISKINDKWEVYKKCPIFTSDEGRNIIRDLLEPKEE